MNWKYAREMVKNKTKGKEYCEPMKLYMRL